MILNVISAVTVCVCVWVGGQPEAFTAFRDTRDLIHYKCIWNLSF